MFEKKQTFPLLLYNENWQKEKKILSCNEEISYCFVIAFIGLFALFYCQRIKKMVQKDKTVTIQDKTE